MTANDDNLNFLLTMEADRDQQYHLLEDLLSEMMAMNKPDVTDKVVDTVAEEVQLLLNSGVMGDELEKAESSYLETRKGGRANDSGLAATLSGQLATGRDMKLSQLKMP